MKKHPVEFHETSSIPTSRILQMLNSDHVYKLFIVHTIMAYLNKSTTSRKPTTPVKPIFAINSFGSNRPHTVIYGNW